jgi:hypothetical protein
VVKLGLDSVLRRPESLGVFKKLYFNIDEVAMTASLFCVEVAAREVTDVIRRKLGVNPFGLNGYGSSPTSARSARNARV